MKYQDVFDARFIQELNHTLGRTVIVPREAITYSIDIERILHRVGYQVNEVDDTDIDCYRDDAPKIIWLRNSLPLTRRRFLLAYELGDIVRTNVISRPERK